MYAIASDLEPQDNSSAGLLSEVTYLSASRESAGIAREYVRTTLGTNHPALDDVVLLTSEVVTNAVLHSDSRGGGLIGLAIAVLHDRVHLYVADAGGASIPHIRPRSHADIEGGWGLMMVECLSCQWQVYDTKAGRTFWFEVMYPTRQEDRPCAVRESAQRAVRTVAASLAEERALRSTRPA